VGTRTAGAGRAAGACMPAASCGHGCEGGAAIKWRSIELCDTAALHLESCCNLWLHVHDPDAPACGASATATAGDPPVCRTCCSPVPPAPADTTSRAPPPSPTCSRVVPS
jgi:hypothetical protein